MTITEYLAAETRDDSQAAINRRARARSFLAPALLMCRDCCMDLDPETGDCPICTYSVAPFDAMGV